MNDINIACFMSCVKTKSFSATANDLSITHQAISRNIQKLEEEIGYKLFIRKSQTVSLTKAGEYFFRWLSETDNRLEWASDYFYHEQNHRYPHLRIAFVDWLGLPRRAKAAIKYMESDNPEMNIDLYTGSESFVFQLLRNHKADVVIAPGRLSLMAEELPDFFANPLVDTESLQLVYSKRYTNSDGSADYNRLFSEKLLTCDHMSQLNEQLDLLYRKLCSTAGYQPIGVEYVPNFNSVISEVVIGNGFTFAPAESTIRPAVLLNFEPLEGIALAEVPVVCVWRLTQGSEHMLKYIERLSNP